LLATGLFFLALTLWPLARHGWNPTWFHKFGDTYVDVERRPADAFVFPGLGYDGQFYYTMALDPFGRNGAPRFMDGGVYRYNRVGLPWLAGLLSFGQRGGLSWAFLLINFLSLLLGVWAVARLYQANGLSGWHGIFFGFAAGLAIAYVYSTPECLAFGLMAAGLLALRRRAWGWAAAAFSWAVLTRETALYGVLPGLVLGRFSAVEADRFPRWPLLFPVAVYGAWQIYLKTAFGDFGFYNGATRVVAGSLPFVGFFDALARPDINRWFMVLMMALVLAAGAAAMWRFVRHRGMPEGAVLMAVLVAVKFYEDTWLLPINYGRVLADVFFWALVAGAYPGGKALRLLGAANAAVIVPVLYWLATT